MPTTEAIVRGYLDDLIAVVHHVSGAVERQCASDTLAQFPEGSFLVQRIDSVLKRHLAALEYHAKAEGGSGPQGVLKDLVTSVTGFAAGVYGAMRGETASRMLRDDYTALSFVTICTGMLQTTALSVGDASTAALTQQHLTELAPMVLAVHDHLPTAVISDLTRDKVSIMNTGAAEITVRQMKSAWQAAATASA